MILPLCDAANDWTKHAGLHTWQAPETHLEQRSNVHIEAQVSETSGDDLGTSVVTILSHLGHQQSRVSALVPLEISNSAILEGNRTH